MIKQIKECKKIRENKLKNSSNENKLKIIQTHPQAIYISRLLNLKNIPEPVNSSNLSIYTGDFYNHFNYIMIIKYIA